MPENHAGSIHTYTIATNDLDASRRFYCEGLGMVSEGPLDLGAEERDQYRALWGVDGTFDWDHYILRREGAEYAGEIRLLHLKRAAQPYHQSYDAFEVGPFSMGFPNTVMRELDTRMRELGFDSRNPLDLYEMTGMDGAAYPVLETIFDGPDFVHVVAVERGGGQEPISPVNDEGMGGPGYTLQLVTDRGPTVDFYTKVLGLEIRLDMEWETKTTGAMAMPEGNIMDFVQLTPGGSLHGYVLIMAFKNLTPGQMVGEPRLPQRGLVGYTFPVPDLDEVLDRARAQGSRVQCEPVDLELPGDGPVRVASLIAPNGFMVELFEKR